MHTRSTCRYFVAVIYGLMLLTWISGCSSPTPARPGAHTLSWTINGNSYTADEVDAYDFSNVIIALKDTGSAASFKRLEIMLIDPNENFDSGVYSFNTSTAANVMHYSVGSGTPSVDLHSSDGTLTITSKSGNIISGNFSATLIDGTSTPTVISGSFANVSID